MMSPKIIQLVRLKSKANNLSHMCYTILRPKNILNMESKDLKTYSVSKFKVIY